MAEASSYNEHANMDEFFESANYELSDTESDCFFSPMDQSGCFFTPMDPSGCDYATVGLRSVMNNLASGNNQSHFSNGREQIARGDRFLPQRSKVILQEHIHRLAQPKRVASQTSSMTLAEAVLRFQVGATKRFRASPSSKPKTKPMLTKPKPFSFERRNEELLKKKEERFRRVLEEEKKAREFHARPPPKALKQRGLKRQDLMMGVTRPLNLPKTRTENLDTHVFRARPATVLQKKLFEPKKDDNHVVKIEPFQFSTNHRVEARKQFDGKIKEKEAQEEAQKKVEEEIKKILEERKVAKLRKQMVVKAQPIKKYKDIKTQSANKVTQPKGKCRTDKIRDKENIEQ